MIITMEILFCLMQKKYPIQAEHLLKSHMPADEIRIYEEGMELPSGTLVLIDSWENFSNAAPEENICFLICAPAALGSSSRMHGFSYAVLAEGIPPAEVQIFLLELCNRLRRWDARFAEEIFRHGNYREVMAEGREFLDYEYSIIDQNMVNLYSTPGYLTFIGGKEMERMPSELIQALMLQPEFHAVAKLGTPFYYYDETNDIQLLCRNLFLEGQYYARIVMYIGERGAEVSEGIKELLDLFGRHMEHLIRYTIAPESRHTGDQLHYLFRALAEEKQPDPAYCASVLASSGWNRTDTYAVIKLRFYEDRGWDSQLDTALPYLVRELEGEWPGSCAIIFDTSILWLVNTSVSGGRSGWEKLRQKAAFFVRDHVCHAGVSPLFRDYFMIPDSVRTADAALEIGLRKHPEFWYYLFDDYRLDYMMEKISSGISPAFLRHPAIKILEDWDRKKGTELSATLEAYLGNNLNMTAAAEKLYIHRTTFCRRMNQIRRLTGLNMSDRDTVLTLLLSYRMLSDYSADGEDGRK